MEQLSSLHLLLLGLPDLHDTTFNGPSCRLAFDDRIRARARTLQDHLLPLSQVWWGYVEVVFFSGGYEPTKWVPAEFPRKLLLDVVAANRRTIVPGLPQKPTLSMSTSTTSVFEEALEQCLKVRETFLKSGAKDVARWQETQGDWADGAAGWNDWNGGGWGEENWNDWDGEDWGEEDWGSSWNSKHWKTKSKKGKNKKRAEAAPPPAQLAHVLKLDDFVNFPGGGAAALQHVDGSPQPPHHSSIARLVEEIDAQHATSEEYVNERGSGEEEPWKCTFGPLFLSTQAESFSELGRVNLYSHFYRDEWEFFVRCANVLPLPHAKENLKNRTSCLRFVDGPSDRKGPDAGAVVPQSFISIVDGYQAVTR